MIKLLDTLNLKCHIKFEFDDVATTYTHPYSPAGVVENTISTIFYNENIEKQEQET